MGKGAKLVAMAQPTNSWLYEHKRTFLAVWREGAR